MSEQTAKHGPAQDEYLDQQTRGGSGHVEEFHQIEPGATDDDPDRRGRLPTDEAPTGGMSQADIDLRAQIAAALGRSAFPGDRERLLEIASGNFAEDRVLDWLRRLPEGETFANMQDASRAMGLPVEEPEAPRG